MSVLPSSRDRDNGHDSGTIVETVYGGPSALCRGRFGWGADRSDRITGVRLPHGRAFIFPIVPHIKGEPFGIVTSIRGLPLGVRDGLQMLFGSQSLDIADPGAEFQGSGAPVKRKLPIRRLVAAGCSIDHHCLVYYERGGAAARTWRVAPSSGVIRLSAPCQGAAGAGSHNSDSVKRKGLHPAYRPFIRPIVRRLRKPAAILGTRLHVPLMHVDSSRAARDERIALRKAAGVFECFGSVDRQAAGAVGKAPVQVDSALGDHALEILEVRLPDGVDLRGVENGLNGGEVVHGPVLCVHEISAAAKLIAA
jgi:hypothetical protein